MNPMLDHCTNEAEKPKAKRNGKFMIALRIMVFVLLIVSTVILYQTGWMELFLKKDEALAFLESLGAWKFLGFVTLQVSQVVLAPIPGEVTGLIGGYLFGIYWGVLLSSIGLIIGSFIAFSISRAFGRPLVERFVDKSILDRFDYLIHHRGSLLIFFLFLFPGFPKDYLCFVLGLGHMSTFQFLVVSSIGRLFGTTLLTLGGDFIRYQQYGRLYVLIGIAIAFTLIAFVFRNRIEKLLKALHLRDCKSPE